MSAPEQDPTGRSSKDPGAKLDAGKVRMGLVLGGFANALTEVAKVGTFGAAKYSDNGWEQVPNAEGRYTDALLRHVFKHMNGEVVDPEWGLFHLAHAAWNVLAVLEKELEKSRAGPVGYPYWATITVTRPIGGSPEQAAPLKGFDPTPVIDEANLMRLRREHDGRVATVRARERDAGEPADVAWINVVSDMMSTVRRYQVISTKEDAKDGSVHVICRDRASASPNIWFRVPPDLFAKGITPEGLIGMINRMDGLHDKDIATFTGYTVYDAAKGEYVLRG